MRCNFFITPLFWTGCQTGASAGGYRKSRTRGDPLDSRYGLKARLTQDAKKLGQKTGVVKVLPCQFEHTPANAPLNVSSVTGLPSTRVTPSIFWPASRS